MIVLHKLRDRASEVPLPKRNHSIETFFLDRPNESLGVRIRVRGALWCQDHVDAGGAKPLSHGAAHRQRMQVDATAHEVGEITFILHPALLRMRLPCAGRCADEAILHDRIG